MTHIARLLAATAAGLIACAVPVSGQSGGEADPVFGIEIPAGYRDWTMISIASVGDPVSDLRVKLGNDVAVKAFRDGTRPFPDGTIIARLAYRQVTSEDTNAALRPAAEQAGLSPEQVTKLLSESFVAGPLPTSSSWSRTPTNMPRPAAGASPNSPTANLTTSRCRVPAFPATSPARTATMSSPSTHLSAWA